MAQRKRALVSGAGGFIGHHLIKKLKSLDYWVRGVDIREPEFSKTSADEFRLLDLRSLENCERAIRLDADVVDEVCSIGWTSKIEFEDGIRLIYPWVGEQVRLQSKEGSGPGQTC
jgi:GDP-D-mannose dehydratase